ncbi:MAG: MBL fold metallo-hydrolase [Candidatus Methanospirareceae archaeon]
MIPLAFDSFGARSMATYIETDDVKIVIDPGVSLAPSRYNLPPHEKEIERMNDLWGVIKEKAKEADILIVTHYHYDHHEPDEPEVYKDKIVYIKHPKEKINKSQEGRASYFIEKLKDLPKSLDIADGKEFRYGNTLIKFSPPVFHGTNPKLGYVVEVSVTCGGEKVVYTSDVEGASVEEQVRFIIEEKPDIVILDGPMTYMLGFRYSRKSLQMSIENMKRMIGETSAGIIVVEHHFMRDLKYKERIAEVYEYAADKDVRVITAAEFLGRDIEMLEAKRKELYEKYPETGAVKKVKIREE